ncbi:DMT family transporter [Halotalea alkalilenta]|uniref:DMT family transporter n=1 Tax=Halotalea alkalilenta TaxID=376489 RepID=UPI000A974D14|nr:DMT family transporter [Halotalea alkalilenta]
MTEPRSSDRLAHLQLHIAAALFGLSALIGAALSLSPTLIVLGRGAFALLALWLLCPLLGSRPWREVGAATAGWLLLGGALLTIHWLTFFLAVQLGGVALGTLGFACFPAFTTVFEWLLLRSRPSRRALYALGMVSLGLVLVTPNLELGDQALAGLLWGVCSGALYALLAILNRATSARVAPLVASWWQCLTITLLLAPFALLEERLPTAVEWGLLALLGIGCTALAYTLFVQALGKVRASAAAVVIALEPVYAIAAAWLLLGEIPATRTLAGGALILLAVVISARAEPQRSARASS